MPTKTNATAKSGARPHRCPGKRDHDALRSRSLTHLVPGIGPSSARCFHSKSSIRLQSHARRTKAIRSRMEFCVVKTFGDFEFDDRRRADGSRRPSAPDSRRPALSAGRRPGELMTREETRADLWPDTTVDFDHSLDVVVSRLRTVLATRVRASIHREVPRGLSIHRTVTTRPDSRPANQRRHWVRPLARYAPS